MVRGKELEEQVYEAGHIQCVLDELERNFEVYFRTFAQQPLAPLFKKAIEDHSKEQPAYQDYLDLEALGEFEYDPNAFKQQTSKRCPIIRRCLMSQDEVMKDYKRAFNMVSGRDMLNPIRKIAEFGAAYAAAFDERAHEAARTYDELGLAPLNQPEYGCFGVIGYGIQSSLLHGLYPREFAHRSQNAVWSRYFLSDRQSFGLRDGSEFLMVHAEQGTCEQNYFYPADLFGFYSLKLYLMLKAACAQRGVQLYDDYRYIYLGAFDDHVAGTHRHDILTYRRSSEYVESQPWF